MSKSEFIPSDFYHLLNDFMKDLFTTFPEYKEKVGTELLYIYENKFNDDEEDETMFSHLNFVFNHCKEVFPERFFDILYKNESIYETDSEVNVTFFPNINFREIWNDDISEKTKEILWKYLQVTLFTVVKVMDNESNFGDTAKLFEAINEDDLQKKMQETFESITSMFDLSNNMTSDDFKDAASSMAEEFAETMESDLSNNDTKPNMEDFMNNMPTPEDLQDHIKTMLDGKIGRLAQDIAAETAADMNFDDEANVGAAFENMVKNPTKLLGLVKKIGTKIDERIKSGELKESELMCEATDLMNKMKNMPGMGNMEEMLNKMASNLGGKGSKFNMNAFNQKAKTNGQKEKMLQELEKRRAAKMQQDLENNAVSNNLPSETNNEKELTFKKYTNEESQPIKKTPLNKKRKNKNKKKK